MMLNKAKRVEGADMPIECMSKTEKQIWDDPKISYMIPRKIPAYGYRGVECDGGWSKLIIEALYKVADIDDDKSIRIALIKEKFGAMRIHLDYNYEKDGLTDKIFEIVSRAEAMSHHICEHCGAVEATTTKTGGWLKTYCESCHKLSEQIRNGEKEYSEWE